MKGSKLFIAVCIFTSAFCHLTSYISAAQYTKLFDFTNDTIALHGYHPYGSLVSDGTFLYGLVQFGGTYNFGTLFKIKPDGIGYSILINFSDTANGGSPPGSLIYDGTFLYGMTGSGVSSNHGSIFKIKPDGTGYSKLHDFTGKPDGDTPNGALMLDSTFLYGTTQLGGTSDSGTVFKIKTDGTGYIKLLDFTGPVNGREPSGDLISDGTFLYGMTEQGGTSDEGVIFKIKPDGTGFAKLLDFNGTNGRYPYGSFITDGTFFYGMTLEGGTHGLGTIFKIKPDGTGYSDLMDFSGHANGSLPIGSLITDGTFLYGMASAGGIKDSGVVFKIKPDGTGYSDLFDFAGTNGSTPTGSLISDGTFLYGMTSQGGTGYCMHMTGCGVVFKLGVASGITENNLENDVIISPNPTSGVFNLKMNQFENLKMKDVEIYNVMGECIHRQIVKSSNFQIDLSAAKSGVYFLQLKTENEIGMKKIVISR
jgi:uncharacterized repeat protein (TIGR03803 family)